MNVELRHLRALVALGESDTFTTAAAVLRTTQPTLSRTITQLEEIAGVRLVERTTREMSFTPAGRRFCATAREVLSTLDNALAELCHAEAPLRLGWAWVGLGRHTVPLLQKWKRDHAGTIELSRPHDPVEAIRRDDIDAALVRTSIPSPEPLPDLAMMTLFTEKLVAAIAADDSRAEKNAVTLAELAEGPVAVCATAPTVTSHLWDHTGRTVRTITVANTEEWLTRISVGDAVGVTAEATTYNHQVPDVVYRPIEDSPPVEVALAWPATNPHPHVHAFAQFARDYFARLLDISTPPFVLHHGENAERV
ncbi:LysR family transcriptional regulator [Saccharomonospora xinjiangensis]|uniref:LysR family transcriptional regulator n=1 Tax=Saccharomonospora xinjiangensis TaxID=75294 RepID=UPI00350F2A20